MIVNFEKKFIFVGIPFSACSAISKELLEHYGCEVLLHKHASIPALLLARPDIKIVDFKIVAVVRDPMDASLTLYYWLKNNRNEHFTRSENFIEYGGTVTKRHRKLYSVIQKRNMNFEQYLDYCFTRVPYDSILSENRKFLTEIIRYEKLQEDFKSCFSRLGLKIDRDLPSYNLTENKIGNHSIDQKKILKYFGPFLIYNANSYRLANQYKKININQVGKFNFFKFCFFRILKSYHRLRLDMSLIGRDISHID